MKKAWILFLIFPLLLAACKKDPIKLLPEATQSGENIVACIIDGKLYHAFQDEREESLFRPCNGSARFYDYNNSIYSVMCKTTVKGANTIQLGTEWGLSIEILEDLEEGKTYYFNDEIRADGQYTDKNGGFWFFLTTPNSTGSLTITKLTPEIISGTFHFTASSQSIESQNRKEKEISVTDGRFDLKRE